MDYWSYELSTDQAKNVASTFNTVFTSVIRHPNTTVENLNYFSTRNKSQVEEWNSVPLEKVEKTIHEIFEHNVISNPALEAVCAWDGSLSYLELDEHASRIALYLAKTGVGPEVFVPLCFPKSKWNVVAMLAVLKAGGACKWSLYHHSTLSLYRFELRKSSSEVFDPFTTISSSANLYFG